MDSNTGLVYHDLPELIQSMEIVGDDDQDLTYGEWIYEQTGSPLGVSGIEPMGRGMVRANRLKEQIVPGVAQSVSHYGASVSISTDHNRLAKEPGMVVLFGGMYEEPNDVNKYGAGITGGDSDLREMYDGDKLRSGDAWIQRLSGQLGAGGLGDVGDVNTLNYLLNGCFDMAGDWDPEVVTWDSTNKTFSVTQEASEGSERFPCHCHSWGAMSIKTDIGNF